MKIELTPRPEMVRHLGRQFPPFSVILSNKQRQIWIQREKIVEKQQSMDIFSKAKCTLEALSELLLTSNDNFD